MIKTDIAIIGAGLTGLTTAYYLKQKGKDFKVFDKKDRVGGVIQTEKQDGFTYENGPNTGTIGCFEIAELFEALKDDCTLEEANNSSNKRYIQKNDKWYPLPYNLRQAIFTPLFSFKDKLRILGEPFRAKGTNPNETLAELVKRRMGQSFLDYAVDPFISGVYAGNPYKLVTKYALPKLYNLEQKYGSFIKGAIAKKMKTKTERDKKVTKKVFSVKGGLSELTNALHKNIGEEKFVLKATGIEIRPTNENKFTVKGIQNEKPFEYLANKVITTTDAFELKKILPFIAPEDMKIMIDVKYAKLAEIVIGYKKWEGMPLDGFGGLIPYIENSNILGVLFISSLFSERAPKDGALLTIFMGGVRKSNLPELSDEKIKEIVKKEMKKMMGVKNPEPDLFKINRYERAITQYYENSENRFEIIKKIEAQYSGLILRGNMIGGIGMYGRVKQGKEIADMFSD